MVRKIRFDNDKVVTYSNNQSTCGFCNHDNKGDVSLKYDVDILINDIERLNDALEELQSDFDDLSHTVETVRDEVSNNYDVVDGIKELISIGECKTISIENRVSSLEKDNNKYFCDEDNDLITRLDMILSKLDDLISVMED